MENGLQNPFSYLQQLEEELMKNQMLRTENNDLKIKVESLTTENNTLTTENERLRSELAKYQSPHIPSSKQLYPKKRYKQSGLPRKNKKKRGGSKKGKTGPIWQEELPPTVVDNYVEYCMGCNKKIAKENQEIRYTKSILEIPEKIVIVHQQHNIFEHYCECGTTTIAKKPTLDGTYLGPNLLSFVTSSRTRTGASYERISLLIEDSTGVKISQTAIHRGYSLVCDSLKPVAIKIATEVMNSDYVQIDETSHKLVFEGKRSQKGSQKIWVWVARSLNSTYYHIDMTRSHTAIDEMLKFLEENKPPPMVVSDLYSVYLNSFEINQFCWAHFLRDSKDLEDKSEDGKLLHRNLSDLFLDLQKIQMKLRKENVSATDKLYNKILQRLLDIGKAVNDSHTKKLRKRIEKRAGQYLTFLKHPQIPMTNNAAEQSLKAVIVHRSNGKPLRSINAMEQYGIILTVLNTWKLQNVDIMPSLRRHIIAQIGQSTLSE